MLHRAYGLTIASEIEIPEMAAAPASAAPDVTIIDAGVIEGDALAGTLGDGVVERLSRTACRLRLYTVGEFVLEGGRTITVRRYGGVADALLRQFLLGGVLGGLLHQRGMLPLHVCALKSPRGTFAFTGDQGAGKSTLASLLHRRNGWPIVSDDVAVLERDGAGRPTLQSGIHRLKLWEGAASYYGVDAADLPRDATREEKVHLNDPQRFALEAEPLTALLSLERGEGAAVRPVGGVEAFAILSNAIYRPELIPHCAPDFQPMRLARWVGAFTIGTFERPWSMSHIEASAQALEEAILSGALGSAH